MSSYLLLATLIANFFLSIITGAVYNFHLLLNLLSRTFSIVLYLTISNRQGFMHDLKKTRDDKSLNLVFGIIKAKWIFIEKTTLR